MSSKNEQIAWHFDFGLEQDGPGTVTVEQANDFMEAIVALAEQRGLIVGGGYCAYSDSRTKSPAGEA